MSNLLETSGSPTYADIQGIPEHSVSLMTRASRGRALRVDDYLFYTGADWIIGIGYPLEGEVSPDAFQAALRKAVSQTGSTDIRVAAPNLSGDMASHITKEDVYYVLATDKPVPSRLKNVAAKAGTELRLEAGTVFTPAHRRLWAEFTRKSGLPPNVQALYGCVEEMLAAPDCELVLLNAWMADGSLAACLVIDEFMPRFDTYLVGAHSKEHYAPHASDALFHLMVERARKRGKPYIHLGLGVNQGIARFKRKWGGIAALPYVEARWRESGRKTSVNVILQSMNASLDPSMDERELMLHDLAQRPYRMLWRLEKNGRVSWIGGTAHFFCKSFEKSFRRLFREVDTVLFEGHLDEGSLESVALAGKRAPDPESCLHDLLTEEERRRLERMVRGPEGPFWRFLNMEAENKADVRWHLRRTQHWYCFFALWCAFLERYGWRYSVDLEAWRVAHSMGKHVLAMEDIEE
ncbi:MAG: TraB/GumN family protein, partial [Desulfovibrionaceae bacterium]|nr:TraB/GumN family protein [Desulfovibrionaceae bacterium]